MRLRLVLVGAILAVAMAATPATLASGGRNPQTAGLQVALRAQGLYRGTIDAISGPETVAATRAFQRMEGCPGHGSRGRTHARGVRPARPSALRRAHAPPRRVRLGRRRAPVPAHLRQGISVPSMRTSTARPCTECAIMQKHLHLPATASSARTHLTALVQATRCRSRTVSWSSLPRVPITASHASTLTVHVVRAGETLSSIARRLPHHGRAARAARITSIRATSS